MATYTVSGILDGKRVSVTWDNGTMSGDNALVTKMLDIAIENPYIQAREPLGLIPVSLRTALSFVPLARLALDKVTKVEGFPEEDSDEVN